LTGPGGSAPRRWPGVPALFIVLFVATIAVTAIVVRARTPDLVLEVLHMPRAFSPDGDGSRDRARISFFVRQSDPDARVEIVGPFLRPVRTLDADVSLEADQRVSYVWNGRTNSGRPAPPGSYRLMVTLPSRDRVMVFPRQIQLEQGPRGG
jgi:hypothetical protein